jgi:hypothetical protein
MRFYFKVHICFLDLFRVIKYAKETRAQYFGPEDPAIRKVIDLIDGYGSFHMKE